MRAQPRECEGARSDPYRCSISVNPLESIFNPLDSDLERFVVERQIRGSAIRKGKSRSTTKAGVELIQQIFFGWEDTRHAIGVFCDLFKAFYCVHHNTLIRKLRNYGVTGRSLELLEPYLKLALTEPHMCDPSDLKAEDALTKGTMVDINTSNSLHSRLVKTYLSMVQEKRKKNEAVNKKEKN
ncbi:hypothetical protein EVAR_7567_1 [Eumeta japonica]|uniref:Reverse transcriptase domain-containing protein n=1 Tax=Eumeta variegata TaxID=151549 RepID=A0A4C1VN89_EUMVA|nr:hypothetical protein EVAR_7567_1 [Eumeta japonica]